MTLPDREDSLLRSVALQNAHEILVARQRAEDELIGTKEALRESQQRLTAALTAAGTGTFRWNFQDRTVEWDGNLNCLFGLTSTQPIQSADAFVNAIHADDRSTVEAAIAQCASGGADFDMQFRAIWPDGSVHWITQKAKTVLDDAGRPWYMTGACADITEQKVAEEAVRSSAERLRAVFNQAAVGITVASLDGRFLDHNEKFSQILGYSSDELRSRTFLEITHPDDVEETRTLVSQMVAGERPDCSLEKRYIRKDGGELWSLTSVGLLRDESGRPQQLIGVIEDITARRGIAAALREESRVLELLNETGKVLASQLEVQEVLQVVTDKATRLSGAEVGAFFYNSRDENGDTFLLDTLSGAQREAFEQLGNPRATALFEPTFRGESPIRIADVLKDPRYGSMLLHQGMPAGHFAVRSFLAVPVRSRSGEVLGGLFFGHSRPGVFAERAERLIVGVAAQAGIAIDNARLYDAAQKAAEDRQTLLESERAARTAAERMSEVKDEFLATLSHELRTPLNAILGWSQLLKTKASTGDELIKGLETIERNALAQTRLIEDLLDMSRITSGKLRLDVQPLRPATFIEGALETVKPSADAKGIRLEQLLDPSAGPVFGDAGRLQQVVWNLLSNSIKFTPKGGKVQVLLQRVNSQIEISVADTGMGIDPAFLPHLFERFRQADATTTRQHGGLGLGMSIVKSLVELHGGTVAVASAGMNEGTTVTVTLPVSAVRRADAGGQRVHPQVASTSVLATGPAELGGLTVLVVDDHADARDLIERILQTSDATVITASSSEEALALVESHRPDVLVSDIGMPGGDGYELLKQVRALGVERGGAVPAIALTAFARSEDRTRSLRAGFAAHVAKPVEPPELVATVASVARRGQLPPQR